MATMKDFDGTGDKVSVVVDAQIDPSAGWFFGIWLKADSLTKTLIRIGDDVTSGHARGFVIILNGFNNVRFVVPETDQGIRMNNSAINTGTWYRLMGKYTGSGWPTFYVDGDSRSTSGFTSEPLALTTGDAVVVGESSYVVSSTYGDWDGSVGFNFFVNTTSLPSDANMDGYLKDPQSVIDEFGPSGTTDADALKYMWGFCGAGDETDLGGEGNDGTVAGSDGTVTESPTDYPSWDPCGSSGVTGSATIVVPVAVVAADGTVKIQGSANLVVPVPQVTGAGHTSSAGAASVAVPVPVVAAAGTVQVQGAAVVVVPVPVVAATGQVGGLTPITGAATVVVPVPVVAATGKVIIGGVAGLTVPVPVVAADGTVQVQGAAAIVVPVA